MSQSSTLDMGLHEKLRIRQAQFLPLREKLPTHTKQIMNKIDLNPKAENVNFYKEGSKCSGSLNNLIHSLPFIQELFSLSLWLSFINTLMILRNNNPISYNHHIFQTYHAASTLLFTTIALQLSTSESGMFIPQPHATTHQGSVFPKE